MPPRSAYPAGGPASALVLFHVCVKSSAPTSTPHATFLCGTDVSFLGRERWGPFHSPATLQQRGDSKSRSPSGEQELTAVGRHVERRCTSLGKHQISFTSASDHKGLASAAHGCPASTAIRLSKLWKRDELGRG